MLRTKHLGNTQTSDQVDVGYYAPILTRVLEARRQFHAWVDTLPEPVRNTVLQMSQGNQKAPEPGNLVGERDAFWLGDIVGASEESQLMAAVGSIAGYAYFLHQDHVIDGDGADEEIRHSELAKNFLYAKLLESFQAITPNSCSFWGYWTQYLSEYTAGSLSEVVKSWKPGPYSRGDLALVAARSAPVKVCAASLALGSGRSREIPRYEAAIEELAIGLHIRDDLADCVEDMLRGSYTPAINRLVGTEKPTMDGLMRGALCTNGIEMLINDSTQYLLKASQSFGLTEKMSLQSYLEHLFAQNRAMERRIHQIKGAIPHPERLQNPNTPLSIEERAYWHQIEDAIRVRLEY